MSDLARIKRLHQKLGQAIAEYEATLAPEAPGSPEPPPTPDPDPGEPEPPPEPPGEPEPRDRAPQLPDGMAWTLASSLGPAAMRDVEMSDAVVMCLQTDARAGSPATFQGGVLHGVIGPGPSGGTGGVYGFDGDYYTASDRVNPASLTDAERAEIEAAGLGWPLLVYADHAGEPVGTMTPETGEIRIEDPTAEDGQMAAGMTFRFVWRGADRTAELAALPAIRYDVPVIGRPPIGAALHCDPGGLIIHPRGEWGATVETPGATAYGEALPAAPLWGDVTGEGALESMDWTSADPGTQPHHGAHIHACRGLRAGVIRFANTIGDPVYTDGDPEYGPAESRPVDVTASGGTFAGPIDEGARKHTGTGKPRAVLFTPDGEYVFGPVYETWGNRMPILRESDRPAMARFKEDPDAFAAAVIGWATVWGQIEWTRPVPDSWLPPGLVSLRGMDATCLAPVDVEIDRIIAGPSGRASAVFVGHDGLRITNASGPSIAFRDGLLHDLAPDGGYTNAAVQGSSRRGTVAIRRDGDYGDWLIAGCRVPWKDHVEPGKDIEPGEPGESPSEFQNVGRNAWGHLRVRVFEDKAGAISGGEVGPVSVALCDTDRSGTSGLSIDDASEATVTVSGRGEGVPWRYQGEDYPWLDLVVARGARGADVTLESESFGVVDSRAEVATRGGRVLPIVKG